MKLKNKKTGEIRNIKLLDTDDYLVERKVTTWKGEPLSLAKLNEEWEDYKEQCWYITPTGEVREGVLDADWRDERRIGNYFKTREEAEKAVEKLKAWKRLKDKGFEFRWIDMQTGQIKYSFFLKEGQKIMRKDEDDLLLLFGGEE